MPSSRPVMVMLLLTAVLSLATLAEGDDVKHKKIIIKVPKKINHVHHHHVKKVHIWKHKPKPVHSVHIAHEEEEPISIGEWSGHGKKKHQFSGWEESKPIHEDWEEEEEEEEYEEEDEHKKAGSHHEPVVWKGRGGGKKRGYSGAVTGGRGKPKGGNYKGERAKRQKSHGHYPEEYSHKGSGGRRPSKKGKKSNKGKKERRPKPKYRPIEKGYVEYSDYEEEKDERPIWPERKEHISWHTWGRGEVEPPVTEEPLHRPQDKGDAWVPSRPILPLPNLDHYPSFTSAETEERKPPPEVPKERKPKQYQPLRVEIQENHDEGTIAGYSSHVGHTAEGDSASFQSVKFGEKTRKKIIH